MQQVSYPQAVEELQFSLAFFAGFDELVFSCNTCVKAATGHDMQLAIKDVVYIPWNDTFMFCLTYKPSDDFEVTSNPYYLATADYLFKAVFTLGSGYGVECEDSNAYVMKFNACTAPARVLYQMNKSKEDYKVFHKETQLEIETVAAEQVQKVSESFKYLLAERKQLQERIDFIDRNLYNAKEAANEEIELHLLAALKDAPKVPFCTRNFPELKYKISTQDLLDYNTSSNKEVV